MPAAALPKVRSELAALSRRLHHNGWAANHDGNLSVRLHGQRFLCTPTAVSKHDVDESMLLVVDDKGAVLEGRRKPFSELELHLAIYRSRPEVDAVIHAHPPHATAWGLVGKELAPIAMPEIIVSLGDRIPTLPRAMPREPAGVKAVEDAFGQFDAALLQGNGVFTCGTDLSQALLRMELVEHYAKILSLASPLGTITPLSTAELAKLMEARRKAGLGPKPKA